MVDQISQPTDEPDFDLVDLGIATNQIPYSKPSHSHRTQLSFFKKDVYVQMANWFFNNDTWEFLTQQYVLSVWLLKLAWPGFSW